MKSFLFFDLKKSSKKGEVALSVNFLVVIVISLVVLGFGFAFLYQLFNGAMEQKAELDSRTEQEILRLLVDQGKTVALPLNIADLYGGENHIFGLGILNTKSDNDQFKIEIGLDKAVDTQGTDISSSVNTAEWLLYAQDAITIKQGEHRIEPIMVIVPGDAPKGKYLFKVSVKQVSDDMQYGNIQRIVVNVH